jgi:hypothetical protein
MSLSVAAAALLTSDFLTVAAVVVLVHDILTTAAAWPFSLKLLQFSYFS